MGTALKKVKPGDPLAIPAATFNTFVDAARDFQARQHQQAQVGTPSVRHNCVVLVRNDSGEDRNRYDVLGIDGPVFDPAEGVPAFKTYPAIVGVAPVKGEHEGKFVVLLEPAPAGQLARAVAVGVVPAQVYVPDADYPYSRADIWEGHPAYLLAGKTGSASIVWCEEGIGFKWALVRLGNPPAPSIFPVDLTQVGGTQGDDETCASWTYDVSDPAIEDPLATSVDPTAAPHRWQRPSVGYLIPATFGYAHWNENGQLVLGWINEVADQEACGGSE